MKSVRGRPAKLLLHSMILLLQVLSAQLTTGDSSEDGISKTDEEAVNFEWDDNGYVFYCPCHGRFGNQADQFLGSIAFAKALNRTLILPPWRSYSGTQKMIPFDEFFQVEPLRAYHRVILAKDFVKNLAETHWPWERRSAFCYTENPNEKPCTTDVPFFHEFWQFVGVPDFTGSESIKGLRFDAEGANDWRTRFPPKEFPVIALRGPPAPFPVPHSQWPLQQFLVWSTDVSVKGAAHIAAFFGTSPFLGIHLRNGVDWTRACALLDEKEHGLTNLMASGQCFAEHSSVFVTKEVCFPSKEVVLKTVFRAVKENNLQNVYIATDENSYIDDLRKKMPNVHFVNLNPSLPQTDLFILAESDFFIGNCVSSFSSFVRRQRDVAGKKTWYFGMVAEDGHSEL